MKVYHGSLEKVMVPEIREPNRTLDYGVGFYTTTSFEQAKQWVERRRAEGVSQGYVNVYEIEKDAIQAKNTLWFDSPTEEWVDFVYSNRNDRLFTHAYDFVYGPVANDRVYAAFALYEDRIINKEELIRELKTYKLVDQLLLHTKEALELLQYIESVEIKL